MLLSTAGLQLWGWEAAGSEPRLVWVSTSPTPTKQGPAPRARLWAKVGVSLCLSFPLELGGRKELAQARQKG